MSKGRFILLVGVLGWGIPCAILFSWWMSSNQGTSFWGWLASLPLWCGGGYVFGLILWKRLGYERRPAASQLHASAGPERDGPSAKSDRSGAPGR